MLRQGCGGGGGALGSKIISLLGLGSWSLSLSDIACCSTTLQEVSKYGLQTNALSFTSQKKGTMKRYGKCIYINLLLRIEKIFCFPKRGYGDLVWYQFWKLNESGAGAYCLRFLLAPEFLAKWLFGKPFRLQWGPFFFPKQGCLWARLSPSGRCFFYGDWDSETKNKKKIWLLFAFSSFIFVDLFTILPDRPKNQGESNLFPNFHSVFKVTKDSSPSVTINLPRSVLRSVRHKTKIVTI